MNETPQFRQQVRIYWDDTDGSGVVYHGNYARFFDRCRTDWLRQTGVSQGQLAEEMGRLVVTRRMETDFLRPAKLDDLCEVSCKILEVKRVSLLLEQTLVRAGAQGEELLVRARVQLACLDSQSFRPAAFPADILAFLTANQARS